MRAKKVVVTGAVGLLGQNLLPRLKAHGLTNMVAITYQDPTYSQIVLDF